MNHLILVEVVRPDCGLVSAPSPSVNSGHWRSMPGGCKPRDERSHDIFHDRIAFFACIAPAVHRAAYNGWCKRRRGRMQPEEFFNNLQLSGLTVTMSEFAGPASGGADRAAHEQVSVLPRRIRE